MLVAGDACASTPETRAADPNCRYLYKQIDGDPIAKARVVFDREGPARWAAIRTTGVPIPGLTADDGFRVKDDIEEEIWKMEGDGTFAVAIEINDADCLLFPDDAWAWASKFNLETLRLTKQAIISRRHSEDQPNTGTAR
jgi:hypothetical protein